MRNRTRTALPRRGVTLVELMGVLVLIGILAAIAYPRIDIARMQVNSAMQGVGMALLAAQRDAVAKQHDVIVLFDTTAQRLRIVNDANNNGARDASERVRVLPLDDRVRFGRGAATARAFGAAAVNFTRIVDGAPSVTFHRNGSASAESGVYLTTTRALSDPTRYASDTRAIEIVRAVGRAEWWSFNGSTWTRGF